MNPNNCIKKNITQCVVCGKKFKQKGNHRRSCSKECSRVYMRTSRLEYGRKYRKMKKKIKQEETKDYFEIYQNYKWFMKSDLSKYQGEWICISKQRVAAHSKNIKDVMQYIESHMLKNFTISKVDGRLRL